MERQRADAITSARAVERSRARARAVPPWLAHARERLRDEFRAPVEVGALAREVGVHPAHFARAFRRHFACSPVELVIRLRIEWAKEALATTDRPLAAIALAAGYADQASFTRRFRMATGCTPGAWRAASRGAG